VIEAALDADFVLAGVNLAATADKTVAPHGCDLFASAVHDAYGLLATGIVGTSVSFAYTPVHLP
jgi:hypothetical protein